MAFEQAGHTEIPADIRQGTRRDAVLFSTGANATHGLPRTREDKWRAVETLLLGEEWGKWADREIVRKTGTGHKFVARVRASLTGAGSSERLFTTKHGTVATMDTAAIGVAPEEVERRIVEAKAKAKAEREASAWSVPLACVARLVRASMKAFSLACVGHVWRFQSICDFVHPLASGNLGAGEDQAELLLQRSGQGAANCVTQPVTLMSRFSVGKP